MKIHWSRLAALLALPAVGVALGAAPASAKPPVVSQQTGGVSGVVKPNQLKPKVTIDPGKSIGIGTPGIIKFDPGKIPVVSGGGKSNIPLNPGKFPPVQKTPKIPLIPGVVIKPKPFIPIDPGFVDPKTPKIPKIPLIPIDPGFVGPKIPKIPLIPLDPGFGKPKIPKIPIIPIDPGIGNGNPGNGNGGNGNGGNGNGNPQNPGGALDWESLVKQLLENWLDQQQGGNLGDIVVVPFPVGGPVVVGNGGGVVVGQPVDVGHPQHVSTDLEVHDIRFVDDGDVAQNAGPRYRITVRHAGGHAPQGKASVMLVASPGSKPSHDSLYATGEVEHFAGGMATVDVRLPVGAAADAAKFAFLTVVVGAPQGHHDVVPADNVATFDRSLVRDVPLKLHAIEASPAAGGLVVTGEGFGREVGGVFFMHGQTKVPVKVLGWQPTGALFAYPADGSCPNTCQLFVARPDGRVSEPMMVRF